MTAPFDPPADASAETPERDSRPPVESVGHPVVDDALDALRDLDDVPVTDHPARFDAVHAVLRDVLSAAGRPDGPGGT